MSPAPTHDELVDLADLLWRERALLEHLLFKLVEAKLILASDEVRMVGLAVAEVRQALHKLKIAELQRVAELERLALSWGMSPTELRLGRLVELAPASLRPIFEDHRNTFLDVADRIERVTRENRRLAALASNGVRESLKSLVGEDGLGTYTPWGTPQALSRAAMTVDEVM